jgi:hypothetical protein
MVRTEVERLWRRPTNYLGSIRRLTNVHVSDVCVQTGRNEVERSIAQGPGGMCDNSLIMQAHPDNDL